MDNKILVCKVCGNVVGMIEDHHVPVFCCNQPMNELVANQSEGAMEKHLPLVSRLGKEVKVSVGSVEHPMVENHWISLIQLETDKGIYQKRLSANQKPEACFILAEDEKVVAAYEYCNLHGLWKMEIKE